jgi:hypothetical protein
LSSLLHLREAVAQTPCWGAFSSESTVTIWSFPSGEVSGGPELPAL